MKRLLVAVALVGVTACAAHRPFYYPSAQDSCGPARDALVRAAERMGFKVTLNSKTLDPRYWGSTEWALMDGLVVGSTMDIGPGLTSCGQVEVLAHEHAHLYATQLPKGRVMEDFCDAVSQEVTLRLVGYVVITSRAPWSPDVERATRSILAQARQ